MNMHRLPVVLFGAFDRHNFGDMLFAHVAARMLEDRGMRVAGFAGLAARDLRAHGGHRVQALRAFNGQAFDLLHVGGEILSCDAWEAAVMLQSSEDAQRIIAAHRHDRYEWARDTLGTGKLAPYVASKDAWPWARRILFNAVGGVALDGRDGRLRAEVLASLARADAISVRDLHTQRLLAKSGIDAPLAPDCAVMVARLFGDTIHAHASQQAVARIRHAAPHGYLAVQFSADFGDDATLATIAAQLDQAAHVHGLAIVLFRAGAAPWHDALSCFERTAARMRTKSVYLFDSLNIWDIYALLAHSRGYIGSSLHGRIVAMAHALPRINLLHDGDFTTPCKQIAFAQTWEDAGVPVAVRVHEIAAGIERALAVDPAYMKETAARLAAQCEASFQTTVSASG
ncbi:polysaccharide pyruvyl transferase family protein [Paraburkholderia sp. C35]|uniref:polysaccharide pyruvyl transferase family protein n=1 Tax=Paraburkholderia sp. C35 TaxID=2126993 RepID=UPI000D69E62B|nr:polysaccharide pyruvyl transferase family protein [Paraburkholderia sp. C35]